MALITVFHGTSEDLAKIILKQGLRAKSCVSNDYQLAEYYADNHLQPIVLKLEVEDKDLLPDLPAIEEPIRQGETADRYSYSDDFENSVWDNADQRCREKGLSSWSKLSGKDCLKLVNSARTVSSARCLIGEQ